MTRVREIFEQTTHKSANPSPRDSCLLLPHGNSMPLPPPSPQRSPQDRVEVGGEGERDRKQTRRLVRTLVLARNHLYISYCNPPLATPLAARPAGRIHYSERNPRYEASIILTLRRRNPGGVVRRARAPRPQFPRSARPLFSRSISIPFARVRPNVRGLPDSGASCGSDGTRHQNLLPRGAPWRVRPCWGRAGRGG